MLKGKIVCIIFLSLSIISCATNTSKSTEDEQKRVKTAKINAQLGIAYLEQNNMQRSKQKLLHALDQASDIPETWYSLAYFYEATGSKKQAATYYQKAIEVAPERGDALNNYGTFLCRSGKYKESLGLFLQAVNDHNYLDTADAYENAGICALKIPDSKLAAKYFKRALAEDPSRTTSIIKTAEILYKNKEYKSSRAHLDEFLALSPPTTESHRLAKLLLLQSTAALANLNKHENENKVIRHKSKHKKVAKASTRKSRPHVKHLGKHAKKAKLNKRRLASKKSHPKKKIIARKKHAAKKTVALKKKHSAKKVVALKKKHSIGPSHQKKKHLSRSKKRSIKSRVNQHKRHLVAKPSNPSKIANKQNPAVPLRPAPDKKYYHERSILAKNESLNKSMQIA